MDDIIKTIAHLHEEVPDINEQVSKIEKQKKVRMPLSRKNGWTGRMSFAKGITINYQRISFKAESA